MGYFDLDDRTRLLLAGRSSGAGISIATEDWDVMRELVDEDLFSANTLPWQTTFWLTERGEQKADAAYAALRVDRIDTQYRNHPQVAISVNGFGEELCYVGRLWVRETMGRWLVDHPNGRENVAFETADEAIEWALSQ